MSDFTIRTSTTPPATVKVQLDPSQSVAEAVAAADAAAISASEAAADAVSADASATTATTQAAAASASASAAAVSASEASTDADDAAASAAAAAATLASSLKIDQNLADLDDAAVALTNLGLTATAAEINTLDGITASTAELNLLDGVTVTTAQINSIVQFTGRNLIINGSGRINQRGYVSGAATSGANQFTLDRWFVVTSGQNLSFTGDASARVMTAPAGGVSQVIEGANIVGGTYVLNWTGTATATVGGVARTKGEAFTLTANTNVTVTFTSGTFSDVQLEAGSIATPFERRTIGQELALCQRYYETGTIRFGGTSASGIGNIESASFVSAKRAAPAVALSNLSAVGSISTANFDVQTITTGGFAFLTGNASGAAGFIASADWAASSELTS